MTRGLIWLYIALLIFEGALRKWIVPGLSAPLLIARDPVVVLIYMAAVMEQRFPLKSPWVWIIVAMSIVTTVAAPLGDFFSIKVAAFGFRTNFLHLPLIFVMANALRREDVDRLGKWLLILSIPMAILMVAQFRVGPGHWLNAGAGGEGGQLRSALNKVRASGTFSFITGSVSFYALIAVYLFYTEIKRVYPIWLVYCSMAGVFLASVAAGSRSLLLGVILVAAAMFAGLLLHPPSLARGARLVVVSSVAYLTVSATTVFKEATVVMKARFEEAGGEKGNIAGSITRIASGFSVPIWTTPLFGRGLGLGTNAGAAMVTGRRRFLFAENEWARIVSESGPILGLLYIALRVALPLSLIPLTLKQARAGNMLPLLFFGAGAMLFVNGQFGPPTILGFAVTTMGLLLASAKPYLNTERVAERRQEKPPTRESETLAAAPRATAIGQPGRWAVRPTK